MGRRTPQGLLVAQLLAALTLGGCARWTGYAATDGTNSDRPVIDARLDLDGPRDLTGGDAADLPKDAWKGELAKADVFAKDHAEADLAEADLARRDLAKPDLAKLDLAPKGDLPKGDLPKPVPDLPKPDLPKPDLPKADLAKPEVGVSCPNGYSKINGSTSSYRVATVANNWLPAEQICEAEGTHLMIVNSASEAALVSVVLPGSTVWTGVTDRIATGQFREVTGSLASYLPWASGQPVSGGIRCTIIDSATGLLSNIMCGAGRLYLCECDGQKALPGSY